MARKEVCRLEIKGISIDYVDAVYRLVQHTIDAVYPNYYSAEAVDFFRQLHQQNAIGKDVSKGAVYGCFADGILVATGSCHDHHIARLFVEVNMQGQGIGSKMLSCLEAKIAAAWHSVVLDASRPAEEFYRKRGYRIFCQEHLQLESGSLLTWNVMKKQL